MVFLLRTNVSMLFQKLHDEISILLWYVNAIKFPVYFLAILKSRGENLKLFNQRFDSSLLFFNKFRNNKLIFLLLFLHFFCILFLDNFVRYRCLFLRILHNCWGVEHHWWWVQWWRFWNLAHFINFYWFIFLFRALALLVRETAKKQSI